MLPLPHIHAFMQDLQSGILRELATLDPAANTVTDRWQRPGGGGGTSCVLTGGDLVEKGGVNYSHVFGKALPASATRRRPELADRDFEATGVSVVLHPRNPHVPASHLNVRFFTTRETYRGAATWWFGGGFDLTPSYPFLEDAVSWHRAAREACAPHGPDLYPRFKAACDTYFHLPHRGENRGLGGLFFDDFTELGPDGSFALTRSVGGAFLPAWREIAEKRQPLAWNAEQKAFQRYRRSRYAEFNLLYDRGTLFGLQSGGRTESILMSLPPQADWVYNYAPPAGSPEAELSEFLQPRDWLSGS
ncbi:MAG TPA: oxygen-dependent coproporphyrinogen oxidase [Oceanipulchritudo sp.]|nr:oxygen-dependent coproporphyrinogen oxidase [Oceanipulchritudo sp.]